jgi:hypothetical protein
MKIRTLTEQIDYMKQKGYHHDSVERTTLLAWDGEFAAQRREIDRLKAAQEALIAAILKAAEIIGRADAEGARAWLAQQLEHKA